jgi:Xaa-Pro aminopeptidase
VASVRGRSGEVMHAQLRAWLAACCVFTVSWGASAGHPTDFVSRRAAALALMDTSAAMVLRSPDRAMRNADDNYRFRQESTLLYLCGLNQPQVTLLLLPSGIAINDTMVRVVMFAQERTDGSGPLPALPDGRILPPGKFSEILSTVMSRVAELYVNQAGPGFIQDWLNGRPMFLERDSKRLAEEKYPQIKIKNAATVVARLRRLKNEDELDQIRAAIKATGDGLTRAMRICRPGVKEYELQAEIEYAMTRAGAWAPSFPTIIGSGPNALILHYDLNRRTTKPGDVVVMDVGAEIGGYAADITRTIPVSGKFTSAQRKIYETVLRAQRATIAAIRPGVAWKEMDATARAVIRQAGFDRFWQHSVSHHLGLDVHDAGAMDTLRAGMVVTVEPGIYIPAGDTTVATEFRGIGVRIEDDVLVTADGREVLSASIPKEIAEIVRAMSGKK